MASPERPGLVRTGSVRWRRSHRLPEVAGRQWDYLSGYNLSTNPRGYAPVSFATLRGLADGYDLLRLVIETRKDLASAQETFAGVFGFLAPVMGPAAAGPAAAAQGVVLGAASFAVGSWQLPSDMIAQVHRGEMIVPAAQTPWAQSLMTNAASAAGSSGVTVNHATHFNISAMDSGDVKRWFKQNGRTVMRTVNESVRLGAHLGLSRLAR